MTGTGAMLRRAVQRDSERAQAASANLVIRAETTCAAATTLRRHAARLRAQAHTARTYPVRPAPPAAPGLTISGFLLTGVVEGHPVSARWRNGCLEADAAVLERADLLVRLEERFFPGEPVEFTARLDGTPFVALMTVMRACDRILGVSIRDRRQAEARPSRRVSAAPPRPACGPGSGPAGATRTSG